MSTLANANVIMDLQYLQFTGPYSMNIHVATVKLLLDIHSDMIKSYYSNFMKYVYLCMYLYSYLM